MELALISGSGTAYPFAVSATSGERRDVVIRRSLGEFFTSYRDIVATDAISDALKVLEQRQARSVPLWKADVLRRIDGSVRPSTAAHDVAGRWLSSEVAEAAKLFFECHAALLPTEPSIYASAKGDLVAEFKGREGALTAVVGTASTIILFATVAGQPFHWASTQSKEPASSALGRFASLINPVKHGTLEASL